MAIGFNSPATSANINNNMASKTANNTYTGDQTFSGAVKVDVISEKTTAAGVTVDGVLLKDGLTDGVDVSVLKSDFDAHIVDAVDAHDASAISNVASGNLAATDVQSALNELQSDIDTRALTSGKLSQFATTSSSELAGVISDETGSGALVFGTGPTLITPSTDIVTLDGQASTPSNPASGFYKLYAKDDGKAYLLNSSGSETQIGSGSGSGGSGINYITNSDAETDTAGWAVYADAAGTNPVDGTGGSANVTWTRSLTSPLIGTASFVLTKDAANRQGQGASYDFTIDSAYQAKMLRGTFNYSIASGTFADDDVQLWVYDVTNAALIALVPFKLKNHTLSSEVFNFEFQTAYNSTSYRLIFHVASTSASAYSLKFDNIQLGPQVARGFGSVVTDWKTDWTPTGTWTTNTTYTGKYRKVGDTAQFNVSVALSGNPNASSLLINLPFTIDTSKMPTLDTYSSIFGSGQGTFGVAAYNLQISYYSTTQVLALYQSATTGAQSAVSNTAPVSWANGDTLNFSFSIPVVGWSSQSQIISTDSPNGVVAAYGTIANTSLTGSLANLPLTATYDSAGMISGNTLVIKTPGSYLFGLGSIFTAASASNPTLGIYKGATQIVQQTFFYDGAGNGQCLSVTQPAYCNAGDIITFQGAYFGGAVATTANATWYAIMQQGPSQILASEKISARYSNTTSTITNSGPTVINFTGKDYDTHGMYLGSGVFKAVRADYYNIVASFKVNLVCTVINADVTILLYKNTSTLIKGISLYSAFNNSTSFYFNPVITDRIWLNAGETFQVSSLEQTYNGTVSLAAADIAVWAG